MANNLNINNTSKLPELSVFFPLYNEEKNIPLLVQEALEILPKIADKYEILLINDGSKDNSKNIIEQLSKNNKYVFGVHQRNKGYGGAVKRGFMEASYDWIFFSDGDLQFKLEELSSFIKYVEDYDLIIGYRKNRAEGFRRKFLADLLKIWNHLFLGFPYSIRDIDCAFKLMKKSVIKECMPLISDGAMLSTELLLKAYKRGYRIKQLGVYHYKRRYGVSTGSNVWVIMRAIRDTFILQRDLFKQRFLSK